MTGPQKQNAEGPGETLLHIVAEWLARLRSPVPVRVSSGRPGNIRTVPGEEAEPADADFHHAFPEREKPETPFEEFNWRLFRFTPAQATPLNWVDTVSNDFATSLTGPVQSLVEQVRRRLRPVFPVIFDTYGWWAAASEKLERDPFYSDAVIRAYMKLPAHQRPVVVSWTKPVADTPELSFQRHGFEDFSLVARDLDFDEELALDIVLSAFLGDRKAWHWFSVARLRSRGKIHLRTLELLNRSVGEALQRASEAAVREVVEKQQAEEPYANPFDELFERRRFIPARRRRVRPPAGSAEPVGQAARPETEEVEATPRGGPEQPVGGDIAENSATAGRSEDFSDIDRELEALHAEDLGVSLAATLDDLADTFAERESERFDGEAPPEPPTGGSRGRSR